jgi:hypothetical protein
MGDGLHPSLPHSHRLLHRDKARRSADDTNKLYAMSPALFRAWCVVACLEVMLKTAADSCSTEPISIPWTNISLAGGVAPSRGISIHVGGAPAALKATTIFNNCRIRNARDCEFGNATSNAGCPDTSVSSFDIAKSTTWESAPDGAWDASVIDPQRQ